MNTHFEHPVIVNRSKRWAFKACYIHLLINLTMKYYWLCNAFEWCNIGYPTSHLYFLAIHTSLLAILYHAIENILTQSLQRTMGRMGVINPIHNEFLYFDWLYFLWHDIKASIFIDVQGILMVYVMDIKLRTPSTVWASAIAIE